LYSSGSKKIKVLALCGGVGGAKLVYGLSELLSPSELTIVVNTADDFDHLGLRICPDIDSVIYALADINDRERGWGIRDETWSFMSRLKELNGPSWFNLGDKDLATHLLRTAAFSSGKSYSEVTRDLALRNGTQHRIVPMSDQTVQTIVELKNSDDMSFQEYFVKHRCEPEVNGFRFHGIQQAKMSPGFESALLDPDLDCVIICPSNPFVSIGPILAIDGVKSELARIKEKVVVVSPLISGKAIKGPAAKMMAELDLEVSNFSIAKYYQSIADAIVIDTADAKDTRILEALPIRVEVCNTLMQVETDKIELARRVLAL